MYSECAFSHRQKEKKKRKRRKHEIALSSLVREFLPRAACCLRWETKNPRVVTLRHTPFLSSLTTMPAESEDRKIFARPEKGSLSRRERERKKKRDDDLAAVLACHGRERARLPRRLFGGAARADFQKAPLSSSDM